MPKLHNKKGRWKKIKIKKMFGTDKKMSAAMIKECDYQRKLAHVGN